MYTLKGLSSVKISLKEAAAYITNPYALAILVYTSTQSEEDLTDAAIMQRFGIEEEAYDKACIVLVRYTALLSQNTTTGA